MRQHHSGVVQQTGRRDQFIQADSSHHQATEIFATGRGLSSFQFTVSLIQCSDDRDNHGSICSCHQFVTPYPDPWVTFTDAMSTPCRRMGTVIARQSHAITMILLAPYRMDASWILELLQLSQDTPIPVVNDQKPLTQLVHLPDGGAHNWTYHCSNLHVWKLLEGCSESWDIQSMYQC